MTTAAELVQQAKQHITEISPDNARQYQQTGHLFLDVREAKEFEAGHIEGAHHIARGVLEFSIAHHPHFQDKEAHIIVYCKSGARSALAAHTLTHMGYHQVVSLAGGYEGWATTN